MNRKDAYKKGMNDISESYQRKFDGLSEKMKESINKQDCINSKTYRIQKELILNEERMDADLDKIFEMLGEERIPGNMGNAVATQNSSQIITDFTNGTLNKYNTFSNLSDIQFDEQIVDAIAGILTTAVEKDMNRKFHEKLTILEQNGLITEEKFERHKNSVIMAKQLTGIGVYAAFSLAPIIDATIQNYLNKNEIIDFIVGIYAYINRELTPLIVYDISSLLMQMNISVSDNKIKSIFEKYCRNDGISYIPIFSKRNRKIFGNTGMDVLAKEIVSRCDLHEIDINNRAMEFVEDFLHIDNLTAQNLVADSKCSQEALSDITWFSAINYRYVFLDFIQDIANAQQFAFYDINNDPYCYIREERKQKMQSTVEEVAAQKGLFLTMGRRKDIINASAKVIQYSLNPTYDIGMDIKMLKREKKVLELYGL